VIAQDLVSGFGLGTLVPLLGLIAGTGVIAPEIDDGSIVYLLSKPLDRHSIIVTKVVVAIGVVSALGAVPTGIAGLILTGDVGGITAGYTVGALVAGIAYCAVFALLGVISRNAVVIGLIYALVWESLVGQFVPGARALSIQQWALAVTDGVIGSEAGIDVDPAVGFGTGVVLLVVVTAASVWYAGHRLRTLPVGQEA
jgi:ABC-2 type transport system permease protein